MSRYRYGRRRFSSQSLALAESNRPRPRLKHPNCIARLALIAVLTALPASAMSAQSPIDLELYARLLESHTRSVDDIAGVRVDYRGLARSLEWKILVRQVSSARPSRLDRQGQVAYWINAYNILTIDLVLKYYPVSGIKDIGSFFSPVWGFEVAKIEGQSISLGQIEHEILRPMGDPRVHSALVCASISCPPLARTPFRPEALDADLEAAMRAWLASPEKGIRIDRRARRITISKIFDWYEDDFDAGGGIVDTIKRYVANNDAHWLHSEGKKVSIRYFDYDWSLNEWKR